MKQEHHKMVCDMCILINMILNRIHFLDENNFKVEVISNVQLAIKLVNDIYEMHYIGGKKYESEVNQMDSKTKM